jgi:membrane fusion protein, multidrug efflux system
VQPFRVMSCGVVCVLLSACGGGKPAASSAAAVGMGAGARVTTVVAQQVQTTPFKDETEALGTAKANESVDLTAKTTNRVVAIQFKEGQYVRKGEVLVEFDGAETRANLSSAQATLRDTQSQYQRSRELYQSKALSESDLLQLEAKMLSAQAAVDAAQARVNDTVIRAPFAGRMGLRNVSVGALVTPGSVMGTLDDAHIIKLDFSVPETYLSIIKEGQALQARSSAWPELNFTGRVSSIASRVDPVSRSVVVRALIDNSAQRLKPGMFMTVHLERVSAAALMIPEQALVPESDRQYVYVVQDDTARKVAVTLGRRKPGLVEVLSGIKAGEQIVIEGGEKLRDGAAVQLAVQTNG